MHACVYPTARLLLTLCVPLVAHRARALVPSSWQAAVSFISEAHPDVAIHVGLVDKGDKPVMPGMGDNADRLFGTDPEDATPIDDGMDEA